MYFEIDQHRIAYDDVGTGQEIILIHGFPLCRSMWGPQTGSLVASGYRVITVDLPGFGESDPYPIDSMEGYSDIIYKLMRHLHLSRAVIGGMSMGGYVLLNFMARFPELIDAGLLIVTKAAADTKAAIEKRSELIEAVQNRHGEEVSRFFGNILFGPDASPDTKGLVEQWMKATSDEGLLSGLKSMRSRIDRCHTLQGINIPCWVVSADRDQAISPDFARALERELPNCRMDIIKDAGHMVNMEKSGEFNRLLLGFLNEIYSF